MLLLLVSFGASLLIALLIIRLAPYHAHISGDHDVNGIQKFHAVVVPRVGGIAVMGGLLAGLLITVVDAGTSPEVYRLIVLCSLPAFLSGVFEDLSKRAGILLRLGCTFLSAGLAWYFLGAGLVRSEIAWLDAYLGIPLISCVATLLFVAGITNAVNIIDGYNGLASSVCSIIFAGIAYIAFQQEDYALFAVSLGAVGASLGFIFWNWPRGLIFLGDGGAYLLGFLIASLSTLLVARHPEVSPWTIALLLVYPIMEVLFTIARRLTRGKNPGLPDAAHLHQLIYKRLMRKAVGSTAVSDKIARNSMTSPYLWVLCSLGVIPAVLFWNNTVILLGFAALFVIVYLWLYKRLVGFRAPKWLVYRRPKH